MRNLSEMYFFNIEWQSDVHVMHFTKEDHKSQESSEDDTKYDTSSGEVSGTIKALEIRLKQFIGA